MSLFNTKYTVLILFMVCIALIKQCNSLTTNFSIELIPKQQQCIYEFFPDNTLGKITIALYYITMK